MFGSGLYSAAGTLATVSAALAGAGIFVIGWVAAIWLVSAVLVAVAASQRGRFAPAWLLLAVVLTPLLAALMLLLFPDRIEFRTRRDARRGRNGLQLCPSCQEIVRSQARRCRFCLANLSKPAAAPASAIAPVDRVEPRLQQ